MGGEETLRISWTASRGVNSRYAKMDRSADTDPIHGDDKKKKKIERFIYDFFFFSQRSHYYKIDLQVRKYISSPHIIQNGLRHRTCIVHADTVSEMTPRRLRHDY